MTKEKGEEFRLQGDQAPLRQERLPGLEEHITHSIEQEPKTEGIINDRSTGYLFGPQPLTTSQRTLYD